MTTSEVHRMQRADASTNPDEGVVRWSPVKSLWFSAFLVTAVVGGYYTFDLSAALVSFVFTVLTLCLGHTLGLHRLLIHRSYDCPKWLEYVFVHLGTLVGMGGPFRMIYLHDIRDWAQRHPSCHSFFIHQHPVWKDFLWQLHGDIMLTHPPRFVIESHIANDRVFRFMQRTWMLQQLPWAVLLYALGGVAWVVWGIAVRVTVSMIGHWLVGYFAHNTGSRDWHVDGHAIQGYNLNNIGLMTMGEGWHNNHHAFPGSARLGLQPAQPDPGWWILLLLRKLGLAWNLKLPADLAVRPEVRLIGPMIALKPGDRL
jgi:stearoyl-CoA desaturase (delta-9 desaturase)